MNLNILMYLIPSLIMFGCGVYGFITRKNMIAIMNKKQVFAYGNSAFEMYEKAPGNIKISYPLSNGVIADIQNMKILIKYFMNGLMKSNVKPGDFFIAVPTDITEVEKRAFYDLIKESEVKARRIMVVEKAIAEGASFSEILRHDLSFHRRIVEYSRNDELIVCCSEIFCQSERLGN